MAFDDGGPAFPASTLDLVHMGLSGMTLRDYFGAAALMGALAQYPSGAQPLGDVDLKANFARLCWGMADAMIQTRFDAWQPAPAKPESDGVRQTEAYALWEGDGFVLHGGGVRLWPTHTAADNYARDSGYENYSVCKATLGVEVNEDDD